jgi:hypothetical protein
MHSRMRTKKALIYQHLVSIFIFSLSLSLSPSLSSSFRMDVSSPTPSDQQYALRWNDFQSSILSSFRHLRDEEDFVDVTLACDQRSFTAHKV